MSSLELLQQSPQIGRCGKTIIGSNMRGIPFSLPVLREYLGSLARSALIVSSRLWGVGGREVVGVLGVFCGVAGKDFSREGVLHEVARPENGWTEGDSFREGRRSLRVDTLLRRTQV